VKGTKGKNLRVLSVVCFWVVSGSVVCWAKDGLLVIAHGAPAAQWNAPVLAFGKRVERAALESGRFAAVRLGMLEAAQPDVASALQGLERQGCERIVAVPLFVAPSGHTLFDVPAVLGIYYSRREHELLKAEGTWLGRTHVPLVLTNTLSERVLAEFVLAQVRKWSKEPKDEALVLFAHGSENHGPLVDTLLRHVLVYCCAHTGIDYAERAYVRVGQAYFEHGVPAVLEAAKHKKRVLVVGVFVCSTAESVRRRALREAGGQGEPDVEKLVKQGRVVFANERLVDSPAVVQWVLKTATEAARSCRPDD